MPTANWLTGSNPRHSAVPKQHEYIYEKTSNNSFEKSITPGRHSAMPRSPMPELEEIEIGAGRNFDKENAKTVRPESSNKEK